MMECPSCLRPLSKLRTPHGFIWVCAACHGRSVTLPVLRKVGLRPEFMRELGRHVRTASSSGTRNCPHCGNLMPQVRVQMLVDRLVLDVCLTCNAIWFDPSEYERLPREPQAPSPPDSITPEARQAIALLEVQHAARREARKPAPQAEPDELWQWIPALLGLPVLLDGVASARKPWLTWGLVAVCVMVFLATAPPVWRPSPAIQGYGFVPRDWERHALLTFATSFFLHAGFFHLLSNMWALWIFGSNAEERLGPGRYVMLLSVGHVAGLILHAGFTTAPSMPMVGASAGISALIAFFAVVFPRARLGFLILGYWVPIPAAWAVILYALLQLIGVIVQSLGAANVSYLGHVGGLAVGICAACIYISRRRAGVPRVEV